MTTEKRSYFTLKPYVVILTLEYLSLQKYPVHWCAVCPTCTPPPPPKAAIIMDRKEQKLGLHESNCSQMEPPQLTPAAPEEGSLMFGDVLYTSVPDGDDGDEGHNADE